MDKDLIKHIQTVLGVEVDGICGPITRRAIANKLISITEKEIGVSEIGTSNSGPRVKEYQATTDLGGTNWPWCAAFICWIIKQSEIFSEKNRPKTAAAFGFEEWGRNLEISVIKNPSYIKRGDIVIYTFSHIGICSEGSDYDGDFQAIEGNTNKAGSREGGSVLKKNRNLASVRSVIRF